MARPGINGILACFNSTSKYDVLIVRSTEKLTKKTYRSINFEPYTEKEGWLSHPISWTLERDLVYWLELKK